MKVHPDFRGATGAADALNMTPELCAAAEEKGAGHTLGQWRLSYSGEGRNATTHLFSPDGRGWVLHLHNGEFAGSDLPLFRLAKCGNACDGVPTEQLQPGMVRELVATLRALVPLADTLAERDYGDGDGDPEDQQFYDDEVNPALDTARALLARIGAQ